MNLSKKIYVFLLTQKFTKQVLLIVASVIGVAVLRLTLLLLLTRMSNAQIVAALISSMISVGIMCIFSAINAIIAIKLTEMEIPRTQWEFENSLVYKTFLMEFVITLTPSFYLAFFKVNHTVFYLQFNKK